MEPGSSCQNEEGGVVIWKVISGDIIAGYAGSSRRERRTHRCLWIVSWVDDDKMIDDAMGSRQTGGLSFGALNFGSRWDTPLEKTCKLNRSWVCKWEAWLEDADLMAILRHDRWNPGNEWSRTDKEGTVLRQSSWAETCRGHQLSEVSRSRASPGEWGAESTGQSSKRQTPRKGWRGGGPCCEMLQCWLRWGTGYGAHQAIWWLSRSLFQSGGKDNSQASGWLTGDVGAVMRDYSLKEFSKKREEKDLGKGHVSLGLMFVLVLLHFKSGGDLNRILTQGGVKERGREWRYRS